MPSAGRDSNSKRAFGNRLKLRRIAIGATVLRMQSKLHDRGLAVSEQAWRNWEKGRSLPAATLLPTLAAVLRCDIHDLVPAEDF